MATQIEQRLESGLMRLHPAVTNPHGATINDVRYPWYGNPDQGKPDEDHIFHVIQSRNPGLSVFINSDTHGGEASSVEIANQATTIAKQELEAGKVVTLPHANAESGHEKSRGVRYPVPDGITDLNRVFTFPFESYPSSRIQRQAWSMIRAVYGMYHSNRAYEQVRPRNVPPYQGVLLDLHTEDANTSDSSVIYARLDPARNKNLLAATMFYAEILGIPVAIESPGTPEMNRSFTAYAARLGIPSITIEAGEAGEVDPIYAEIGRLMIGNFMAYFGMIAKAPHRNSDILGEFLLKNIVRKGNEIKERGLLQLTEGYCMDKDGHLSQAKGTFYIDSDNIQPGVEVRKGQQIGIVVDQTQGLPKTTPVFAKETCVILSAPSASIPEYRMGDQVYQAANPITDGPVADLHKAVKRFIERGPTPPQLI